MSNQAARPQAITETVEEYLARGGVIQRIEDYPDPSDRVICEAGVTRANPVREA